MMEPDLVSAAGVAFAVQCDKARWALWPASTQELQPDPGREFLARTQGLMNLEKQDAAIEELAAKRAGTVYYNSSSMYTKAYPTWVCYSSWLTAQAGG